MSSIVPHLKATGQDFQWYPTDLPMLNCIKKDIRQQFAGHEDKQPAVSILDCGAGDGRALTALSGGGDMYAIEKSERLIMEMPEEIFIVGTEFHQSTLIDKKTDVIFCNPPYSEYGQWTIKIIKEANCSTIYLIIPQRWKESGEIAQALKLREAEAKIIGSFDFLHAERQARAVVDILKIDISHGRSSYHRRHETKTDPFDIWFDEHFSIGAQKTDDSNYASKSMRAKTFSQKVAGHLIPGKNLTQILVELYRLRL